MRYLFILLFSASVLSSCKSKSHAHTESDVYYTCSMDPQVIEHKPGKCPICKMDLTPVKKKNGEKKDELQLSEQQIHLGNIQTDTIRNGSIGDQLVLTATLNFDQMKASSVSSRVMGRVERLYYKNIGDYVKKGSALYEIYTEDLNNAKQEYLLALDKKKTFTNETVIDFDQLIQSAKNKLLLWGLSEAQVNELTNTKKATPTTTFYSTANGPKGLKGLPDGLKISNNGIVFASGPGGIWIFNSEAKLLGKIRVDEHASNVALSADEKTMYITNDMQVLRVKMRD